MKRFFIETENFWKLLLISFAILSLLPISFFLSWMLCLGLGLFLFRKNRSKPHDFIAGDNKVCLSPIDGRVLRRETRSEDAHFQEVLVLKMGLLNPYGLLCPFDSSIESVDVKHEEEKGFWNLISKGRLDCSILFINKLGFGSLLRIQKAPWFGVPKLWLRAGDKAAAGACFGLVPYGGLVKIYFPKNVTIAVSEGDKIIAGETIIAGVRG